MHPSYFKHVLGPIRKALGNLCLHKMRLLFHPFVFILVLRALYKNPTFAQMFFRFFFLFCLFLHIFFSLRIRLWALRALSEDTQPIAYRMPCFANANSRTLRMADRSVQKERPVLVGVLPSQGWTWSTRKSVSLSLCLSDLLRISGTCYIQRE